MGCELSKTHSQDEDNNITKLKPNCSKLSGDSSQNTHEEDGDKSSKSVNQDPVLEALESPPRITENQKVLLANTWKLLVENISRVGVVTFMKLFETHPDVQEIFMPFRGLSTEDLKYSKELRAHALRVMGFVQKVVGRINDPNKCEELLRDLGRRHVTYGAKADYVDLVGPQFLFAIKPALEAQWSEDIEDAWSQLFHYIGYHMKRAMREVLGT